MQFAKVFEIEGAQVLFLLQPRDEDGVPEVKMITYVGNACVVMGNRLVPPGTEQALDPQQVLAKTREMFDGFGQAEAEQAYRMAQKLIEQAAREQAEQEREAAGDEESADSAIRPGVGAAGAGTQMIDSDFQVPLVSTAVH